ncbi:MAG: hypothetical protein WC399_01775 [Bacilli bacterium]|jgi:hypothetical protein
MVLSAIIDTILQAVFGFQYLVDIILGIFLLVALGIGVSRGVWRSLWRLIFIILVLVLVKVFALEALTEFVNTGFWQMTGMGITMDLGGTPYTFTSIQELVAGVSAYAEGVGTLAGTSIFADADFLVAFSLGISRMLGWLIVVLATMVVTWLVSGFLWLILWGPLLKSVKKKKVKLLGAVLGLAQGYVYALVMAISFSPILGAVSVIDNPTEAPYKIGSVFPLIASGLRPENSLLMSITDVSNPFGFFTDIITFEYDGDTYNIGQALADFVDATDTPAA